MANWVHVRQETEIQKIKADCGGSTQVIFPVVTSLDDTYEGYITISEINNCPTGTAGDLLGHLTDGPERRNIFVFDNEPLDDAKRKLRLRKLQLIPVVDAARRYRGTIDKDSSS